VNPLGRHGDHRLALAFLAGHLAERAVEPTGSASVPEELAGSAAMSLPLAWLRTRPLPAALALVAGAALNHAIATPTNALLASILTLILAGFSLTRHHEGRDRWLPLGVVAAAVLALELATAGDAVLFVTGVLGGGAVGGALVRGRALLTRTLAERTSELEALRATRERDAALAERRRIARELHDVVAHTVSIMVVQAAGARRQATRDRARALAALDQVGATGAEALSELDRLFGLLAGGGSGAPTGLADLGGVVERTRAAGLPVALRVEGAPRPLPAAADLALLRVAQESLTNTLKHGGPGATADVAVTWGEEAVEVTVLDTGRGAAGRPGDGARRGLEGMRERLEELGGEVRAGPGAAGGFAVHARLPVADSEAVPA